MPSFKDYTGPIPAPVGKMTPAEQEAWYQNFLKIRSKGRPMTPRLNIYEKPKSMPLNVPKSMPLNAPTSMPAKKRGILASILNSPVTKAISKVGGMIENTGSAIGKGMANTMRNERFSRGPAEMGKAWAQSRKNSKTQKK